MIETGGSLVLVFKFVSVLTAGVAGLDHEGFHAGWFSDWQGVINRNNNVCSGILTGYCLNANPEAVDSTLPCLWILLSRWGRRRRRSINFLIWKCRKKPQPSAFSGQVNLFNIHTSRYYTWPFAKPRPSNTDFINLFHQTKHADFIHIIDVNYLSIIF